MPDAVYIGTAKFFNMIRHIAQHFLAESVIFRLKYMAETGINTIFIIKKAAEIVQPLRVSASKILLRLMVEIRFNGV